MKLVIVSGRSGSGKSTCLHVLEDLGYYCVDNIPASLISALSDRLNKEHGDTELDVAVSIDARNLSEDLVKFPDIFQNLAEGNLQSQIIYLDADSNTLLKRFSETRRKHPLSNEHISLMEAIEQEKNLLHPIADLATLNIDTRDLSIHQLRDIVKNRIAEYDHQGLSLQFQSFGFKHGLPVDADMVYDARCLPNPFWDENLRGLTGLDQPVINFLEAHGEVQEMYVDIRNFLETWLPRFSAQNRSYITVAVGCTGGQHRSVYLCEKLKQHFAKTIVNVQVRHKEFA